MNIGELAPFHLSRATGHSSRSEVSALNYPRCYDGGIAHQDQGEPNKPRRRHLLLRIDRCTHHYQQRGYLHDTGTSCMLMMPPVRCCLGRPYHRAESGTGRKEGEGDKESECRDSPESGGIMKCWMGLMPTTEGGHCCSQVLLISPLFLKQIKLSGRARVFDKERTRSAESGLI